MEGGRGQVPAAPHRRHILGALSGKEKRIEKCERRMEVKCFFAPVCCFSDGAEERC